MRPDGLVFVHGELWRAESDRPLHEGEQVQVEALDGLSLPRAAPSRLSA